VLLEKGVEDEPTTVDRGSTFSTVIAALGISSVIATLIRILSTIRVDPVRALRDQ
jgi:hypothetical protein